MDARLPTGAWELTLYEGPYVEASSTSFESLYRLEYPGLVAVATALTGSRQSAEDLVQDTMVKAFLRWSWLQRFGRPGAWCHRVLTNACRDWRRRRRTERRYLARQRVGDLILDAPSMEFMAFWEAVRHLPGRPADVVALFYAGDRSVSEIASILAVPEGTVRSDLTRARQALAKELGL